MLEVVSSLFDDLHRENINFCHFKSNNTLPEALEGIGDLDLLVKMEDFDAFSAIAAKWHFHLARSKEILPLPFVFHYYGLDEKTGKMVHLHVYFRIITGGSLVKNHWVPLERAFAENTRQLHGVPVPEKEIDLLLFVIRKFIEQPTFFEQYLYIKDIKAIRAELAWLLDGAVIERIDDILESYFPSFPAPLFHQCLSALTDRKNILIRMLLGHRLRKHLPYTVYPGWKVAYSRFVLYFFAFWRARLKIHVNDRAILPGGKIIAFIGGEASGKSTLSKETAAWLSTAFDVRHLHLGKPKKTMRTLPFWMMIRVYSALKKFLCRLFPSHTPERRVAESPSEDFYPHPIVLLLDAIDRYHTMKRCTKLALNGWMIITDRYPNWEHGAIDGPRIRPTNKITRILSRWESHIYGKIARPDYVFKADIPLDIALQRNIERDKANEPEDFIRARHEGAKKLRIVSDTQFIIDTTDPLESCLNKIKRILWTGKNEIQ
jgi:thymidylate kinase